MNLSALYNNAPEYIEFAWVCAPNTGGDSVPINTITPLRIDTEVQDTGNLVSAPVSNQFTLPAGTYYFEASANYRRADANGAVLMLGLRTTAGTWISRGRSGGKASNSSNPATLNGQFKIAASTAFELTALAAGFTATIDNGTDGTVFTLATAGADQRTTIKLWKVK